MSLMRLRELNVGCFGGGTGLPSLLGGLKSNPWIHADAVVTMFDSGGSSGRPSVDSRISHSISTRSRSRMNANSEKTSRSSAVWRP